MAHLVKFCSLLDKDFASESNGDFSNLSNRAGFVDRRGWCKNEVEQLLLSFQNSFLASHNHFIPPNLYFVLLIDQRRNFFDPASITNFTIITLTFIFISFAENFTISVEATTVLT